MTALKRMGQALALVLVVYLTIAAVPYTEVAPVHPEPQLTSAEDDSLAIVRQQYIQEVLATIEGRENEPSSDVFEDVQGLGRVPAGRLLRIMDMGYSQSLGVTCEHCHDVTDWSAPTREKTITRQMSEMARTINGTLLPEIENLDSERPVVNCTTCHRGQVKPALSLGDG